MIICHANKEKRTATNNGKNRTTNQEKIRTLREKETYKYLRMSEGDIIKYAMKEKTLKKNTSRERENHSKPIYIEEISSKG